MGDMETLHAQKAEIERLTCELAKRDKALDELIIHGDALDALTRHEPEGIREVMLLHVTAALRRVEHDGEYVVRVVDEKGTTRIKDVSGTPMAPADLVAELFTKTDFKGGFKGGPNSSGAGLAPGEAGAPVSKGFDPRRATDAEKSEFIGKHGIAAWVKAIGAGLDPGDAVAPEIDGFDANGATAAQKSAFITRHGLAAYINAIGVEAVAPR